MRRVALAAAGEARHGKAWRFVEWLRDNLPRGHIAWLHQHRASARVDGTDALAQRGG